MQNTAYKAACMPVKNIGDRLMGVAVVYDYRQIDFFGQRKVRLECGDLAVMRRKIAIEVQARLADCDHFLMTRHTAQFLDSRGIDSGGVMWMDTDRSEQALVLFGQRDGLFAGLDIESDHHGVFDGRILHVFQDCGPISGKVGHLQM
jgi:hypothetical protein